ncbi:hypothetical protein [Neisseria sp. Ec49-e6-T10]|uniref:hypothetical protein n=1 Tax=Neisseria sp. Ec49-e6-T10 TaxID=3140744 RepID=UPI003EC0BECD
MSLLACSTENNTFAQKSARFVFGQTVAQECQEQINQNQILAILLANKQDKVQEICRCVSDEAFNQATNEEISTVLTNPTERKKTVATVAANSVIVCAQKLNYFK